MSLPEIGTLTSLPVLERLDLVAEPTAAALRSWEPADRVAAVEIDPDLADTAAMTAAHALPLPASGNCVVVAGQRAGDERIAGCVVPATTRADVNTRVRKLLDVRKASFLAMDRAVQESGMEYGGITPVGLPGEWRLLVDAALVEEPVVILGSGLRRSKLIMRGADLATLPRVEVIDDLGRA